MAVNIITQEDLNEFRNLLLNDISVSLKQADFQLIII